MHHLREPDLINCELLIVMLKLWLRPLHLWPCWVAAWFEIAAVKKSTGGIIFTTGAQLMLSILLRDNEMDDLMRRSARVSVTSYELADKIEKN